MTALALRSAPVAQMNWPRIGAWSGTLSMHLWALALLLTPPMAIELLQRPALPPVVGRIIAPPPPETMPVQEPSPPVPTHHERHRLAEVAPVQARTTQPIEPSPPGIEKDSGLPDLGSSSPGPAAERAPTALAYGSSTRVAYPVEAARRGEHGTVVLRVLVGVDGNPQIVEIETSSGSSRLDTAARNAVARWNFRPGTRNGEPCSAWARVPISFDLRSL
jgi:periplasmic protein TonB